MRVATPPGRRATRSRLRTPSDPGKPSSEAIEEKPTHQSSCRVGRRCVQPQCAGHLGRPHPFHAFPGEGGHDTVAGHARRVHDSPQWPSGLLGSRHEPLRYSRVRRYRPAQRRFRHRICKVGEFAFADSSEGSVRPLRMSRPAPRSASHRTTTMPKPPRPPVTMYEPSARTTAVTLACIERRTREPFNISALRPPRDHIVARRRLQFTHQRRDDVVRPSANPDRREWRLRSGSPARTRAASPGNRQLRMRPLRAPIAGSPGSSPRTARPLRVTNHSRGDFPFQPSTAARAATEIAQINSRARRSAPSGSVPSNERFPTNTIMPTGGSSGSAAAFANGLQHCRLIRQLFADHPPGR